MQPSWLLEFGIDETDKLRVDSLSSPRIALKDAHGSGIELLYPRQRWRMTISVLLVMILVEDLTYVRATYRKPMTWHLAREISESFGSFLYFVQCRSDDRIVSVGHTQRNWAIESSRKLNCRWHVTKSAAPIGVHFLFFAKELRKNQSGSKNCYN